MKAVAKIKEENDYLLAVGGYSGLLSDWTTYMIGHEMTALFGLDHAQTLSIILPAVMKVRKKQKS